jgi:rhodanese-related sulfurtransferase
MLLRFSLLLIGLSMLSVAQTTSSPSSQTPPAPSIFDATLDEAGAKTPEISTNDLKRVLAEHSATVLDSRPQKEFATSHIPGAMNVAAKAGVEMSKYVSDVAEVLRLVNNKKDAPLVLYCNGPFCGKSKRLSEELLAAGFTNVRRYQLGIPVWRALGGMTQIESDGAKYVRDNDKTAVWIDVRPPAEFAKGSVPGAKNIPRSLVLVGKDVGELKKAKDDGRLPTTDHNTRIIVFGGSPDDVRFVADAIAHEAFHNVAFYDGDIATLK